MITIEAFGNPFIVLHNDISFLCGEQVRSSLLAILKFIHGLVDYNHYVVL